jgi:hypothetical protein
LNESPSDRKLNHTLSLLFADSKHGFEFRSGKRWQLSLQSMNYELQATDSILLHREGLSQSKTSVVAIR